MISFLCLLPAPAGAGQSVLAAVATNFREVLEYIEPLFEDETGHDLQIAGGSSGKLYTQLSQGAPYDVFLAADQHYPGLAIENRLGVAGSQFTYAIGRLAVYSNRDQPDFGSEVFSGDFRALAIANPKIAPYGAAARETLQKLNVWSELDGRLVLSQNVSGAFAAAYSGAADYAFVALSALRGPGKSLNGSHWIVPERLYSPLRQDAVLLTRARNNAAALELLEYMRRPATILLIEKFGYRTH